MGGWVGVERWVALTLFLECTITQSQSAALLHWQPNVVSHRCSAWAGGWVGLECWVALTLFLESTTTQSQSAAPFHWQPTVVSHSQNLLRRFIGNQLLSLTGGAHGWVDGCGTLGGLDPLPGVHNNTVTICCAVSLATNCCLSQSQSAALLHRQPTVVSHSHNLLRCFIDNHNCCLSQSQSAALLHRQPTVVSHSHNLLRCFIDNQLLSLTVTICCAASSTTNC